MLANLQWAIWMRLAGAAVFPLAVVLAALLQRSLLSVVLIALAMTIGRWLVLRRSLPDGAGVASRLLSIFASRLIPSGIVFIAVVGLAALFRDTSLAREIGGIDLALALVPLALSLALNLAFGSVVEAQREGVESLFNQTNNRFRRPGPNDSAEGPIIEGEYERVDDDEDDGPANPS